MMIYQPSVTEHAADEDKTMSLKAFLSPTVLAILVTALNAIKPLHMDDTVYYYYARQIISNPTHPYGFDVFYWTNQPCPAIEIYAPPVFFYYWGMAIQFFGHIEWAWKLWLLPVHLALTFSMRSLLQRFCQGVEDPVMWMTVLSPVILPGVNLMLDVPALALVLASVAVFVRGCDKYSWPLVVAAGLVSGLAGQTKFTGLSAIGACLIYGHLHSRYRQALTAAVIGVSVFAGIELLIMLSAGQSHLLATIGADKFSETDKLFLFPMLLTLLGSTAFWVLVLGIIGLGASPKRVFTAMNALLIPWFLAMACSPEMRLGPIKLSTAMSIGIGALLIVVMLSSGWCLCRTTDSQDHRVSPCSRRRDTLFLIAWVIQEVVMYFLMSPFPAVRRVVLLTVTLSLLAGRLVALRTRIQPSLVARLGALTVANIVLGIFYAGVDLTESVAMRRAAFEAADWIRLHQPNATIWCSGHWGYQFYAEQRGMLEVVPGQSRLRAGDWVVVPDESKDRIICQWFQLDPRMVRHEITLNVYDRLPFFTMPYYYSGGVAIGGWDTKNPRLSTRIYRVLEDIIPPPGHPS
jgi:hypothetical protein